MIIRKAYLKKIEPYVGHGDSIEGLGVISVFDSRPFRVRCVYIARLDQSC